MKKFAVMPSTWEKKVALQRNATGIFEVKEDAHTEKFELDSPEWVRALLELSGLSSMVEYVKEDRMRRAEPDFVHSFPEV